MREAAQMVGAGARMRTVLLKTEAGGVTGLMSSGEKRGNILTKKGSGSGRARADRARILGGSDVEAGEGGE